MYTCNTVVTANTLLLVVYLLYMCLASSKPHVCTCAPWYIVHRTRTVAVAAALVAVAVAGVCSTHTVHITPVLSTVPPFFTHRHRNQTSFCFQ